MKNEKIKPSHQIGLEWLNDEGERCVTIAPRPHPNGKRIVNLDESTFVGTSSITGMHYYAKLKAWSPSWSVNGDQGGHGGYGGKNMPKMEAISFDAERVLKSREFDQNRKMLGKVGDTTYRFNNPKSARLAAVALFKKLFAPGWVLVAETMSGDGEIISET